MRELERVRDSLSDVVPSERVVSVGRDARSSRKGAVWATLDDGHVATWCSLPLGDHGHGPVGAAVRVAPERPPAAEGGGMTHVVFGSGTGIAAA